MRRDPRVYTQDMHLLAVLDTADAVSYTEKCNDLSVASLRLPAADPRNGYMQAHNIVRIWDGEDEVGLFRIVGAPDTSDAPGEWTSYELEHVMATLVDDVLFGYHEIGGTGIHTEDVLEYILDRQTVTRWQLGECDFDAQFQYKFENCNLLSALFSVSQVLTGEYQWVFDTSTTPWTVSLVELGDEPECEVRYRRNMTEIRRSMDAGTLVTRLYLLGYGEGVNQLTVKDVNNGLPYIDADTIGTWGVKSSVYADTTIESAELLLARGQAALAELKNPYISYTASAVDLYMLTGDEWDSFRAGKLVHVVDEALGVDFRARLLSRCKPDIFGDPGNVQLEIANRTRDIGDSINEIANRQGITELYSQGATNLYSESLADNADETHPAHLRVYVPTECVRINRMLLSWQLSAFRAYERGTEGGGGGSVTSESGGGTVGTTESGGGTVGTTGGGGGTTKTSGTGGSAAVTSESGGSATASTTQRIVSHSFTTGGPLDQSTGRSRTYTDSTSDDTGSAGSHSHSISSHSHGIGSHSHQMGAHSHSIASHRHDFTSGSIDVSHQHTVIEGASRTGGMTQHGSVTASGNTGYRTLTTEDGGGSTSTDSTSLSTDSVSLTTDSDGSHTHSLGYHNHGMNHYHSVSGSITIPALEITIPGHTHTVSVPGHSHSVELDDHTHSVTVPGHTHGVTVPSHTHSVSIPSHTHGMEFGIYTGGSARSVTIRVDGNVLPASLIGHNEADITAYLAADEGGRITRGTWHTVEIVPDGLTRIEATLFLQVFVQSVGGGNY